MNSRDVKIIVLTPVKNEAWVLAEFLMVTSIFADAILVADQFSTDDSKNIAASFPKVTLVDNPSGMYNNASRQQFLLEKARELFGTNNLILALDADELVAASGLVDDYWENLKALAPGTLIKFMKRDLVEKGSQYLNVPSTYFPLGFIDDGELEHQGKPMHSVRVPLQEGQPEFKSESIFFLHLQRLRPITQEAKRRFYQVKEKDFGMNPWYWRRKRYEKTNFLAAGFPLKETPEEWIQYLPELEISIESLNEQLPAWFDLEVYEILREKGGMRYWLDDIWDIDWNHFSNQYNQKLISKQPFWLAGLLKMADAIFTKTYRLKHFLFKK